MVPRQVPPTSGAEHCGGCFLIAARITAFIHSLRNALRLKCYYAGNCYIPNYHLNTFGVQLAALVPKKTRETISSHSVSRGFQANPHINASTI